MTKVEFLHRLEAGLSQLPEGERRQQLEYYEEMLDDRMEDGMSEEEAVASLGQPGAVSAEILQNMPLGKLMGTRVRPRNGWSVASIVLVVLGFPLWFPLMAAFFAVGLSMYLVLWSLMLSVLAVVLAIGIAGVALLVTLPLSLPASLPIGLALLGAALMLTGLSIVGFFGMLALGKGLVKLTAHAARGVKSWFIRKGDA